MISKAQHAGNTDASRCWLVEDQVLQGHQSCEQSKEGEFSSVQFGSVQFSAAQFSAAVSARWLKPSDHARLGPLKLKDAGYSV